MKTISLPGKTFLLGEYAVLKGSPCLIYTSPPHFHLEIKESAEHALMHIHPDSPAGRFYQDNLADFNHQQIIFLDEYQGLGGFGASSAQFLGLYQIAREHQNKPAQNKALLETYWRYAYQGKGVKPSGADLLAQQMTGLIEVQPNIFSAQQHPWPFKDLKLYICHTGVKLQTHTHLEDINLSYDLSGLCSLVVKAQESLQRADSQAFIDAIKQYGESLDQLGLVTNHTQKILKHLLQADFVVAAKGAGAMGADTIVILSDTMHDDETTQLIDRLQLKLITTSSSLL